MGTNPAFDLEAACRYGQPAVMNVSLRWLSAHVDLQDKSLEELEQLLTFAGVEVEAIRHTGIPSERIVVAEIKEAAPHPNADKLQVTKVDAGEGELRQIVCGAKNFKVGDKVPCCLPGADLGGGFVIGEAKMRGVESRGMLAAASEIGLPDAEDGLLILPSDAEIGARLQDMFPGDTVFEVEITPNRPDLLSHRGMARELAALLEREWEEASPAAREAVAGGDVRLEDGDACPFYTLSRISGVRVAESPAWLKQRLESIGLRPINNIVDITNYVLHELGQPLHAFDAAKVSLPIVVRGAQEGEKFQALDGETYVLDPADCVISDASGACLALGGIMGGANSAVTETTTEVLLEAAWFVPARIRRSSRRLGLSSDSSYRFERGTNPAGVPTAAALAVRLILELAGGKAEGPASVAGEAPVRSGVVELDFERLDKLTGNSISRADAEAILTRLGLAKTTQGGWRVPPFRADLQRHIDLVEEIVRVRGLEAVPARGRAHFVPSSEVDAAYDADMRLRMRLAGVGFHECQTIKLISDAQLRDALPLKPLKEGDVIRVALPLSEDHSVLRPSLAPGLVASLERNIRQQASSVRLFELGRVFRNAGGGKARDLELDSLGLLLTGSRQVPGWAAEEETADLFDLKAVIEALVPQARIQLAPHDKDGHVLGADIRADGVTIGVFGMLPPARQRELDCATPVYVAELDLPKLRKLSGLRKELDELSPFPGSTRDISIEAPLALPNSEIERILEKLREPLLVSHECVALFQDPEGVRIAADRRALTYRLYYRSAEKTLKAEEIDAIHQHVREHLKNALPIEFR